MRAKSSYKEEPNDQGENQIGSETRSRGKPQSKSKPMPAGMHTVTPHIICAGAAEAIEFYKKAFGAQEMFRLPGPDGKLMHGSIRIGDSAVMLAEENEKHGIFGPKHLRAPPSYSIFTLRTPMRSWRVLLKPAPT